jgi:hypothetical protein
MMDKLWCNKCCEYTYYTTGGCVKCGQVNWLKTEPIVIKLTPRDYEYFIKECGADTTVTDDIVRI